MGIFSRFNRVLKSNLNSMLDRAEDPEKTIGQTVLEMESELKKAKRELVTVLGTAKRLDKKAKEMAEEVEGWENKAVLALRAGDDELAREALKMKRKAQKKADVAKEQAAQQDNVARTMQDTIENIELKIEDLKARKGTLAAQVRKARLEPGAIEGSSGSETLDDLQRLSGRIDQMEAEVEVHSVLDDPHRRDVEARFRELEKQAGSSEVDDELAALKRRLDG